MGRTESSMTRAEGWTEGREVRASFVSTGPATDPRPPLVVVPGMINSGDELARVFGDAMDRRCVFTSVRGRGRSDAPPTGYTYEAQVSDVLAVVDHLRLERFFLLGHSVGAAFAIGAAALAADRVAGLILVDYPPEYRRMGDAWVERVLANPRHSMPEHAVRGVARDAEDVPLDDRLRAVACPVLVVRGGAPGSLLPEALVHRYTDAVPGCRVEVLAGVGHEPFAVERGALFLQLLRPFLA